MDRAKTPDIQIPFRCNREVETVSNADEIETPKYGDAKRGYIKMKQNGQTKGIPPVPMWTG